MAKDLLHNCLKQAIESDGWKVTHDPYFLVATKAAGKKVNIPIDLGAEHVFAAEKSGIKIAVEIKSFLRASIINEFHRAIGQYLMYRVGLSDQEPDRLLYLAVPVRIYEEIEHLDLLRNTIVAFNVNILIFDPLTCRIISWIK